MSGVSEASSVSVSVSASASEILDSFSDSASRAEALASLLRLLSDHEKNGGPSLASLLGGPVRSRLADEPGVALRFLAALYALAPDDAHAILSSEHMLSRIARLAGAAGAGAAAAANCALEIAQLLSAAAAHKPSRTSLAAQTDINRWLDTTSRGTGHTALQAAVAHLKLNRLMPSLPQSQPGNREEHQRALQAARDARIQDDRRLLALFKTHLAPRAPETEEERDVVLACLEGITYLTLSPESKAAVSTDDQLLRSLASVLPPPPRKPAFPSRDAPTQPDPGAPDTAMQYGLASILRNLCEYPAAQSDEERQLARLRELASADSSSSSETTAAIESRCERVVAAGLVPVLVNVAVTTTATSARAAVAAVLLSLITKQDRMSRARLIQQGVVRALLSLARHKDNLVPLQALAKLLISANPALLFPRPADAAPLMVHLYTAQDADRLQHFEAAMALTNLASLDPEPIADKVQDTAWSRVLDNHALTRRANAELLCNTAVPHRPTHNRLHVLLALCADEMATRSAASATLATLTLHPDTAADVLSDKFTNQTRSIIASLLTDEPPLQLRGLAVVANLAQCKQHMDTFSAAGFKERVQDIADAKVDTVDDAREMARETLKVIAETES